MIRALAILDPGPRATVQDAGRTAARRMGAPVSGVADAPLWRLTQAVAGGPDGAACVEFTLKGPRIRAEGGALRVALGGAEGRITGPEGEAPLPALRSATLAPGQTLTVGPTAGGAAGYLCVQGGLDVPMVIGARATDLRAGFGGWKGRALQAGDVIPVAGPPPGGPEQTADPLPRATGPFRVILGPQQDHFTEDAVAAFLSAEWRVGSEVDRMGARLEGPRLDHSALGPDIASEGLTIGAIQVPGGGQPILLGVESHTIGGYAKIACVIGADIPRIGQLVPGARLRFAAVTADQALAARRAAAAALAR
ncbi:MAG: biotin-dependent carboxyltransferase family protein, partial [Rubrimonas sp.]